MSKHKYKVGQTVDFIPTQPGEAWSRCAYRIVRLLPHEGGQELYRIKTTAETFERIANESELLRSTAEKW